MRVTGVALVPGSCGEIAQGTINGRNFLVTCPVNWFSRVRVVLERGRGEVVHPPGCTKAAAAVRRMLEWCGCRRVRAVVEVSNHIPVGKGMASSTADVAAACYAVAAALGIRVDPWEVGRLALEIEPSDGTFAAGVTLFDHVEGSIRESLGEPPSLGILALDFGGMVDTLEFNDRKDLPELNRANEPQLARALELVRKGIAKGDPRALGAGATISSLANQKILPKEGLESLITIAMELGAYGVNVAHSGTVAGILLPPGREKDRELISTIKRNFPMIERYYSLRLIGGGPRYPGLRHRVAGAVLAASKKRF